MEGEALGEDRHVFGEDGMVIRRWEFGLASPLSRTLELIGLLSSAFIAHAHGSFSISSIALSSRK